MALGATVGAAVALPGAASASGARSGLPWASGVTGRDPDAFADWRGRPLDVLTVFSRFDRWKQMENLGRANMLLGQMANQPERLSIGLAMFQRADGPVPRDDPSLWADAADGAYDHHWQKGLEKLERRLARLDPIVRIGWEWNGSSYP